MALQDKLKVDIAACNMPSIQLISQRFWAYNDCTKLEPVIHGAICLATLQIEIHYKFQKPRYTLQSRAATCNGFKIVCAIVGKK